MRNQSRIPYLETYGVLVPIIISAYHELIAFLNVTYICITYTCYIEKVQISIFTSVVRRTGKFTLSIPAFLRMKKQNMFFVKNGLAPPEM